MGIKMEEQNVHGVDPNLLKQGDTFEKNGNYYLITYYGQVLYLCLNTGRVSLPSMILGLVTPVDLVMREESL